MKQQQDILVRFGARVRKFRLAKGYSQEAFAGKCDLDRTYMGGIERGERNLALRNIEKIAKALDMTISQLLSEL
jgi:transcriptional regulator with XRE-family HTH domain